MKNIQNSTVPRNQIFDQAAAHLSSSLINPFISPRRVPTASLSITYFERNTKPAGQRIATTWASTCEWIEQNPPSAATKNDLPLIKLATFIGDYRTDANLEAISGIEGDYDAEQIQPSDAVALLTAKGIEAFIYTSPSHQPEKPRWRVLCPISTTATPADRHALVGRLNGVLGGVLASESFTPSQAFYVGSVAGGHPVQCWRVKGWALDTIEGLQSIGPPSPTERTAGRQFKSGDGRRAPSYQIALDALHSVNPSDIERPAWLSMSGAFFIATRGLPGSDDAERDWQTWNANHPGNDPAANVRTWNDFHRNGADHDFTSLGRMSANDNARGWALFNGVVHQMPVMPPIVSVGKLLTPLSDLMKSERARNWLIRGIIPANVAGIMYGAPGTGKTFVAIDIAACVASNTKFNGRHTATGPVVYVAGEGHAAIRDRFEAWYKSNEGNGGQEQIHVSRSSISFIDHGQFAALATELDAMTPKPTLVIIDTLFRATAGADVNDAQAMTGFWANVDAIKARYNCTVLVVHHVGRNEPNRSFGSIVLLANADFEISIKDGVGEDTKVIENTKQKDAPEFEPIYFKLKSVHLGHVLHNPLDPLDVEQISSCVCEFIAAPIAGPNQDRETHQIVNDTVPLGPNTNDQRKIGGLLCAIYDEVLKHRGIVQSETVQMDIAIPKDLIRRYLGDVGKDELRNGLNGLGTIKTRGPMKGKAWITATKDGKYTPKSALLKWARDAHYSDFDNTELTADELASFAEA